MEKTADVKLPKTVAGMYKVTERLGAGSFGEIYKGKSLLTNEDVAIKFVSISSHLPPRSPSSPPTSS